jgi:hypothetical protein
MIDATPDTQLPAASIPKLKNLANKGNDVQTLKAIQQISGRPDAAQQYAKIMQSRDAGEGRQRGYDVSGLINSVKSGNYEAPVLLKLATGTYVIGGRTRLYAALALGIPAKVKIISVSTFVKQGQQGVAEGENWSKHNNPRAGGMSKKSVSSYRRSHPGSKIQTAVTTKPSKLKKGSKSAKRRASFCARMRGMKKHRTGAKTAHDPNSNINKSLRRWHCESIEELHELVMLAEQYIRDNKK